MDRRKAARSSCNCSRARSQRPGALTDSIVSNRELFRLVGASIAFTLSMLAVPTLMAVLKQWGWW